MGRLDARAVSGEELRRFEKRLFGDLRKLELLIAEDRIEEGVYRVGVEQEMFLIGDGNRPAMKAMEVLKELDDPSFTTEIALFNLEANLEPMLMSGDILSRTEARLEEVMSAAAAAARRVGVDVCLTGILPTLRLSDLTLDNMTPLARYRVLDEALKRLRSGEPYHLHMAGADELHTTHDNVMPEGCNASFQIHLQVGSAEFARLYNLAQLVTAPILACSPNSPLLFGRRLWRETRIGLFQQSLDTRGARASERQRAARGAFGRDWVRGGVLDILRENVTHHPVLLDAGEEPDDDEDPPRLSALALHNGTVWRWNRPCYGITDGKPHLRIESRYLPSGPTIPDEVANMALWLGLMSALAGDGVTPDEALPFADVAENFMAASRLGLKAELTWLDGKQWRVRDLLVNELLPRAREGLARKEVEPRDVDHYIGIVEERVQSGQSGARWMLDGYESLRTHASLSESLAALTGAARRQQGDGTPVARWERPTLGDSGGWRHHYLRVEQFMTRDILTVHPDESVRRAAILMDWGRIRHVPVEEDEKLVGLVSYRTIIKLVAESGLDEDEFLPIRDIMKTDPICIAPTTPSVEAIRLMNEKGVGSLPVVQDGRLVGIVTEHDFTLIARGLLEEKLAGLTPGAPASPPGGASGPASRVVGTPVSRPASPGRAKPASIALNSTPAAGRVDTNHLLRRAFR